MKILFNPKFLQHNPGSYTEGPYRIEDFTAQTEEVARNGEADITLIHSQAHINLVRTACMNHRVLAEVYLSPYNIKKISEAKNTVVFGKPSENTCEFSS
jgi:hypothetical protein